MDSTAAKAPEKCTLNFNRPTDGTLSLLFSGSWKIREGLPPITNLQNQVESNPNIKQIAFDTQGITDWDSGLLTFLLKVNDYCEQKNITVNTSGLPEGVKRLLEIATAVPEKETHGEKAREPFFARVGGKTLELTNSTIEVLTFIGETSLALMKLLVGKARQYRVRLAVVANRVRANTLSYQSLQRFLDGLSIPFVTSLRDTQLYSRAAENGLCVHELADPRAGRDIEQWRPLVDWVTRAEPDAGAQFSATQADRQE